MKNIFVIATILLIPAVFAARVNPTVILDLPSCPRQCPLS
ncbi:hypothetical protein TUN199_11947 [Pyrenophora tritici-repentis]|nr:hypothetical protein Alg215_12213 [Pyrenophora tritici-repentis]KAI0568447.1 hypothetical protein Alg130_12119 [Pyrenophora tritici-repentis]KAI0603815.1 hypothetical protein TUN205_11946 [Pyrenophora tritici-repentis]KAI0616067.1 hypothetical protein TUN199_11947 [Pyrenophora tritici-repentis]